MMAKDPEGILTKPIISRKTILNCSARWLRKGDYKLIPEEDEDMTDDEWRQWRLLVLSLCLKTIMTIGIKMR